MSFDQIVRLRDVEKKQWTEIGNALGISRDAARRAYFKAKRLGVKGSDDEERPIDPTHREILRLERELEVSRLKAKQLNAKLKATHRDETVFQAAAEVIREVAAPLAPAPAARRDKSKGVQTPVDLVLLLSDEHADEVISAEASWGLEQYNFDVFRVRLERLRDMIVEYVTVHLPAHAFERLWIFKLGDSVNGDIHGAGPKNHFGNTMKAALALGDAEAQFAHSLIPFFSGGVHVVGVSGNHPRRSKVKDYDGAHDNFDYLAGVQIATRLQAEIEAGRASVTLPNAWSAYVEVRGRIWALNHGDEVVATNGLPWVGYDRRNNRVQTLLRRVGMKADYFCAGHYHSVAEFVSAGGKSLHSGAWSATSPYAIEKVVAGGEPTQSLFVVDDKRGLILSVPIYVRDQKREIALLNGEYQPTIGSGSILETVAPLYPSEGLHVVRQDAA